MRAASSICKHCHRLKSVNNAGYCGPCSGELRGQEQRRPTANDVSAEVLTPSLSAPVEEKTNEPPPAPPPPFMPLFGRSAKQAPKTEPAPPPDKPLPLIPSVVLPNLDEDETRL